MKIFLIIALSLLVSGDVSLRCPGAQNKQPAVPRLVIVQRQPKRS